MDSSAPSRFAVRATSSAYCRRRRPPLFARAGACPLPPCCAAPRRRRASSRRCGRQVRALRDVRADREEHGVERALVFASSTFVTLAFSSITTPRSTMRWISASSTWRGSRYFGCRSASCRRPPDPPRVSSPHGRSARGDTQQTDRGPRPTTSTRLPLLLGGASNFQPCRSASSPRKRSIGLMPTDSSSCPRLQASRRGDSRRGPSRRAAGCPG